MKLVLIPCPIAEQTAAQVLPEEVRQAILQTKHFLVENVRTARRFISELKLGIQIDDLTFEILDKDTERKTVTDFFNKHISAELIGIISEAGCPGVADPGALAVAIAQEMGIEVLPLVGPSSILLALMASGFSGQQFRFHGYLPIDRAARIRRIETLQKDVEKTGETQLFIETPYRNNAMLDDLIQQLPGNQLLAIGCNIQDPTGFTQTKSLQQWAAEKPDLHKKPCIFLLGRS
ncbi:SAM-dependent methyltransferase [Aquirufa regiilacus]|uniref:SAM-dependent methyltransferase n=1 Tax=Aquirufa regiilacus TaxID=3024868 RepID=A0ABU3TQD5_9BACT|nr:MULTISPECIES: SAM-dependent methyltransferase [unclassified Aquirufa]MDT8887430.1 SAM-dependent methyltransferase [Aquirufa sp. LEPPI-3A]MDU0807897.1 SAM-dependent methyltransferase [Aquirufa sp. LEOWEIH-7C]